MFTLNEAAEVVNVLPKNKAWTKKKKKINRFIIRHRHGEADQDFSGSYFPTLRNDYKDRIIEKFQIL